MKTLVLFYVLHCVINDDQQRVYLILGIHSMCLDNVEKSPLNQMAIAHNQMIKDMVKNIEWCGYYYKTYDVCNNYSQAVSIVADHILGASYYHHNNTTSKETIEQTVFTDKYKLIFALSFLDVTMSDALGDMMYSFVYPQPFIIFLNPNYTAKAHQRLAMPFASLTQSVTMNTVDVILNFFQLYQWKYAALVLLKTDHDRSGSYEALFNSLIERLRQQTKICYISYNTTIGDNGNLNAIHDIMRNKHLKVVFLFGRKEDEIEFILQYKRMIIYSDLLWVVADLDRFDMDYLLSLL